jgi:hypothetical protein
MGAYGGGAGTGFFASCSGQITTTFGWVPDYNNDDPPQRVIVQEDCRAVWHTAVYPASNPITGACDNGLGTPEVSFTYPIFDGLTIVGIEAGGTSDGSLCYLKEDPDWSFTVFTTPSASVTALGASTLCSLQCDCHTRHR